MLENFTDFFQLKWPCSLFECTQKRLNIGCHNISISRLPLVVYTPNLVGGFTNMALTYIFHTF